jgi:hypothetical protein
MAENIDNKQDNVKEETAFPKIGNTSDYILVPRKLVRESVAIPSYMIGFKTGETYTENYKSLIKEIITLSIYIGKLIDENKELFESISKKDEVLRTAILTILDSTVSVNSDIKLGTLSRISFTLNDDLRKIIEEAYMKKFMEEQEKKVGNYVE